MYATPHYNKFEFYQNPKLSVRGLKGEAFTYSITFTPIPKTCAPARTHRLYHENKPLSLQLCFLLHQKPVMMEPSSNLLNN